MNEKQREKVRQRLMEERNEHIEVLADFDERFKERLETGDDELTKYPLHMADEGTDTMEQEKDFLVASQEGRQFLEIDEALRRLHTDPETFGTCERCGNAIGMERLEMVPWARLCITCKREAEESGEGESAA